MEKPLVLYRYECSSWTSLQASLYLKTFKVLKYTPTGCWFDIYGVKKWTSLEAKRCYAYPTIKEALESYVARKKRQLKILNNQIKGAELMKSEGYRLLKELEED